MFKRITLLLIGFMGALWGFAQEIKVSGYFLEDSITIGISTPYVLTARYPRSTDLLFPDSLYNYSPYELAEKRYFPTVSTDSSSYDSAVYFITSFEIDSVQYFELPVFALVRGGDSVAIVSGKDSVILQHMVTEIPDAKTAEAMPLRENTAYRYVDFAVNYPYLTLGAVVLVALIIGLYFIFGKSVKKWFVLRKLARRHADFLTRYRSLLADGDSGKAEKIVGLWKSYHETLDKLPFTKMTTRELLKLEFVQKIGEELKATDRIIYGKRATRSEDTFDSLLRFSENRYADKVNEVKYG